MREAKFVLDGKTHEVSRNKDPHTLHGGEIGFNKANWSVLSVGEEGVSFQHVSPDGDMGYPGTLTATATYSLTQTGEVKVEYSAITDKPTIINLVNHTYFNLTQRVSTIRSSLISDRGLALFRWCTCANSLLRCIW